MKCFTLLVISFLAFATAIAQPLYFPPKTGNTWEVQSPAALGWNTTQIDPLLQFLDDKNSKAFIVLKDGKIIIEKYFDNFKQDSIWYWASAGKTVTSFLVGIAQQENLLKITDKTSKFLGAGWTQAPPAKEDLITIFHQLTMTSGLDDNIRPTAAVPDPDNCLTPNCLQYKTDPGTRWAYHNAPYRLLQDVVAKASGLTFQQYTNQRLKQKIGMTTGTWIDYVFHSRPRDMARFGLLMLNKGVWENDVILKDTAYYRQLLNTSQNLNKSYGYLWWLNGKESYMLPSVNFVFPGGLIPSAPADVVSALGKNDQKIYVVPSLNLVVIRMGDSAGEGKEALSSFDTQLWEKIMAVIGNSTTASKDVFSKINIKVYPNPGSNVIGWECAENVQQMQVFDGQGKLMKDWINPSKLLSMKDLEKGMYYLSIRTETGQQTLKWIKM